MGLMPLYKVTFHALQPVSRSVFFEDELDELDEEEIKQNAWLSFADYLRANNEETAGWEDPEVELIE